MEKQAHAQAVADAIAAKATTVTVTAGSGAFLAGMTANEIAAYGGLLIAAAGLLVNVWFRWQSLKIERHRAGLPVGDGDE